MPIDLTTPALLFPTISLLLLAYTNRFLSIAALVRSLHANYQTNPEPLLIREIGNLRFRIRLIQTMQAMGVLSLLLCTMCMFLLRAGSTAVAEIIFSISLILMMGSLALSVKEIQVSVDALNLHLRDLERPR